MAQQTKPKTKDINSIIHLPPRATTLTIAEAERRINAHIRLNFGIPEVDKVMIPAIRGDMIGFVALTSQGKTTTMIRLLKYWGEELRKTNPSKPPLVIYVTWETTVEEFMLVASAGMSGQSLEDIGRGIADIGKIKLALANMLGNNIVVLGVSRDEEDSFVPTLGEALEAIRILKQSYDVAVVAFDYLQRIPDLNRRQDRRLIVAENAAIIKDYAASMKFVAAVAIQANRRVYGYPGLQMPTKLDCDESAAIEHTLDKLFGFTLPPHYMDLGTQFQVNDLEYTVNPNTMVMALLKQRFGPCNRSHVWVLDADMARASYILAQGSLVVEGEKDDRF